jgi:hypothetical protein
MIRWTGLRSPKVSASAAALVAACVALLLPLSASAATVANGNFETGTLSGWQTYTANEAPESRDGWYAYSGTTNPLTNEFETYPEVQSPPEGTFGATSAEGGPGLHVLYQDVALEPYFTHTLSLTAYYNSFAPLAVPTPNSLDASVEQGNQQYRIDVMKPTAPIASVNPEDILATLLATKTGDPETLAPTALTANLTPFAGQTVRLRFAEVDNEFYFDAGADAVSIASTPPSNVFTFGKLKLKRKNGTGLLKVNLPGPGLLTLADAGSGGKSTALAAKKTKKKALIKSASVTATAAGTASLKLKPTGAGRKILKATHELDVKALVSFTPTGGTAASQTFTGKLKLKVRPKKRKSGGHGR